MLRLFITSNNTNSGKTFIAKQIITILNNVCDIKAYKPIETACSSVDGRLYPKDAHLLNNACKSPQDIDKVCPYRFSLEASGELASVGQTITIDDLVGKAPSGCCVVEGAGGFFSPLVKNKLNADLAQALGLPIVIVIEDKLGAISEALLTIRCVESYGLDIFAVVLNQKTTNNLNNMNELKKYTNAKIISYISEFEFRQEFSKLF
jgi:dethiobiotin synthetase